MKELEAPVRQWVPDWLGLQSFLDVRNVCVEKLSCGGFYYGSGTLRKARKTLVRFNQQFQGTAVRTDDTVVAPLLAGNLFEAGMDGHGDAVPTVV